MVVARVTQRMMVEHSLTSLNRGMGRLSELQEQLSTGRVINRPSDSPTGTNSALHLREQLAANDQYARNADDGIGRLSQTDTALTTMLDAVRRARGLTLQGMSTGSTGPTAREALATELEQIRDGLIASANTTYLGRPIFAGTSGSDVAYDAATGQQPTVDLDGDGVMDPLPGIDGTVNRRIGPGPTDTVPVNLTGTEAFGPDGNNLFDVLSKVITDLRTEPVDASALQSDLDSIDAASDRMKTALADVGSRVNRLEDAVAKIKDSEVDLKASLSEVENVDIAKAVVDLQMQEVAYQAALGATARVLQPSLLDFLR
jgi:flagellar hook-associated protein 3 FlgL